MHPKIPFGIGQIGKSFRNEITPRDFLFRLREFEHMELLALLSEFNDLRVRALIIDLRGNVGGQTFAAQKFLHYFIGDGVAYQTITRDGISMPTPVIIDTSMALSHLRTIPLFIIIDRYTASAAEMVAIALQDYKRATIIGEPSLGKDSIQVFVSLHDGAELLVTARLWRSPFGRSVKYKGIIPDVWLLSDEISSYDLKISIPRISKTIPADWNLGITIQRIINNFS